MADKQVSVKVVTEKDLSGVQAIEDKVKQLQQQKLQLQIDANTSRLDEVNSRIDAAKVKLSDLKGKADVDDSELKQVETEISQLESEKIDLQLSIETDKLKQAQSEAEKLDDTSIDLNVNNISAMEAIDQIGQGFDRLKQGAGEVAEQMGVMLEAAGKQETNKAFLEHAVGAEKAAQATEDINAAVQKLPGDDTIMQGLLSQAVAKDASLTADELNNMGTAAADYFSAMEYYGKSSSEAFQDMNNYLLTGNTAELERSPILANHIDKLKEATTIQERSKLLQEALNEEHWGGMSQQDTYNNKLETFNGMLERGKYNLGGMFQEGAKGAMDFVMQLDAGTNGLVGMALAAASFATPVFDAVMGLGQMATGIKALKDLEIIQWFRDLELMTKLSAAADWLLSAAQGVLNAVMSMNPIVLVVLALIALAAALVWAYYNVDWFRQMVDNAWQSLVQIGQIIYGYVMGAIQWLSGLFTNFTSQLGLNTNDWIQAILGFILFLPQLPLQIGIALANALAKAFGFKGNFVQTVWQTAVDAVNRFADAIRGIGEAVQNCLDWAYNIFMNHPIVQAAKWLGEQISHAFSALGLGQGSPGKIYEAMKNEIEWTHGLMKNNSLTDDSTNMGANIANNFNPNLQTSNAGGQSVGNSVTINIDSVDSRERIQQIVKAVEDALAFDNLTAGRSV